MLKRDPEKIGFFGVAMLLIVLGVTIFSVGTVMWFLNFFSNMAYHFPIVKIIGGLLILAMGYIVLELELIRKQ